MKTASGATAVQAVYPSRGSRDIEHIGSAHGAAELEFLKAAARQGLGQGGLDLGLECTGAARRAAGGGPLPVTSSRMGSPVGRPHTCLRQAGLGRAADDDEVFRQRVLARIIEPASKLDSLRVLEETRVSAPSYRTLLRCLPVYAKGSWRQQLAAACVGHAGMGPGEPAALRRVHPVFRDRCRGRFRESRFSRERRPEPQITIGLLTDQAGFPLMVNAFEGNMAETIL